MNRLLLFGLAGTGLLATLATAELVSVAPPGTASVTQHAAMQATPTAQTYIDQGKYYLVQHNILAARDQFKLAVQTDSTNQEANLLYGVTRVFAVVEEGQSLNTTGLDSVKEILQLAGFTIAQFNIYDSDMEGPEQLASTTPNTDAIIDFLKTNLLPEVNGAINDNLSKVTSSSFTSVIDTSAIDKASGSAITVDYADALIIRALLQAVKCNLELLQVYGLNVTLPSIQAAPEQLMTYKQFFQDATFLTPKNAANLATARTALISFIDTYASAAQYLKNRSGSDRHLFVIDVPLATGAVDTTSLKLDEINSNLAAIKKSLNSGTPYLLPASDLSEQDRFVNLSTFFNNSSPINFRAQLANCGTGKVLADPTVGGLFPLGLSAAQDQDKLPSIAGDILGVACSDRGTPQLKVNHDSIELADADDYYGYYTAGPKSFTISNQGTANLTTNITLKGLNKDQFTLSSGTCASLSPTLAPGASCSPSVSLNQSVSYPYSILLADILITSNDVSAPRTFLELLGHTSASAYNPGPSQNFTLTIARAGTGNGSVNYAVNKHLSYYWDTCSSASCSNSLPTGTYIEFHPISAPGSVFSGWSGCDSVKGGNCYVGMYSARSITATFTLDSRPLTVMASPPGGTYGAPQSVTLATSRGAGAAIHYTLNGATPTASSPLYSGPLTIAAPLTLKYTAIPPSGSATPVKSETYSGWHPAMTLTVSTAGSGGGTVNSIVPSSGLIVCSQPHESSDVCASTQPYGTLMTLIALPDSTSLFSGWSFGSCAGSGPCSVTLNVNTAVTATFIAIPPVKVESPGYANSYHATILDAFTNAHTSAIIRLQSHLFVENLIFNRGFPVSILGGYDAGFASQSGFSTIDGTLTIGSGSATIENLIVK